VRRHHIRLLIAALALCSAVVHGQAPPATDLDRFMVGALQRRDIDRQTLSDYVLDEVESFEVLGPGRVPFARMRREYTWYVRDGVHVRSPVKFDGVPIPESSRREYEEKWMHSELNRRKHRTERDEKRAQAGKGPALSAPSINEPRFISEAYFLDFKFEPGNYYLAGKESLDGREVLKIDYLPSKMFDDEPKDSNEAREPNTQKTRSEGASATEPRERSGASGVPASERAGGSGGAKPPGLNKEDEFDRKMGKTSQVTLWVDPATKQIVKYTFDNVWMDFLPGGWLVKVDDLRASMAMGQPFPDVWLPKSLSIHAGITLALGPMEMEYKREFSKYRKAAVSSKITVPKTPRSPKGDGGIR
jgi:hypothetical protein